MKKLMLGSAAMAMAALTAYGASADSLRIEHVSPGNALVRATLADASATDATGVTERYLLLPVEEGAPLAHVRVLSDGRLDETLNINLACGHIDYYVPLRLEGRDGRNLILDIRTNAGRSSVREAAEAIWCKEMRLSDEFDTTNREAYRPVYHHTPLYGWMNDPNGMFYKDGLWHLSFQWNPYGSKWENMTWGHSTSPDLVHWHAEEPVIWADPLGTVFSGSAVVDAENTAGFGKDAVVALFTSAGASQMQSLAHSGDSGFSYERFPGNPVLTYESESRDPNMFWDAENSRWVLLLASALEHEMLIFTSPDLKEWTLQSKFGRDYGSQAGVWECPDMMELPVEGTNEKKWALICNINPGGPFGGSATQYFIGDFDGTRFICDTEPSITKWMDYGKDHYATVSFSNAPEGRHTVIGWMSNWQYANDVPTRQFRSANTLPREVSLFRTSDGSTYMASRPAPEVELLRGKAVKGAAGKAGVKGRNYQLPAAAEGVCEIELTLSIPQGETAQLTLSNPKGEEVVMTVDPASDTFSMDRSKSGLTDFSEHFPCTTVAPMYSAEPGHVSLRLFLDRSSLEAFEADGRFAMTNLIFPTEPYSTLSVSSASGKAKVENLTIYPLK